MLTETALPTQEAMAKTIEEEIQQSKFRDAHQKAFVNMVVTYNRLQYLSKRFFEQFGITQSQYNVLRILRGQPTHSLNTYSLKDRMMENRSSDATRLVDRMVKTGLVKRATIKTDKRCVVVKLTPEGLKLLAEIDAMDMPGLHKHITEEEAITLSYILDKIRNGVTDEIGE